MAFNQRKEGRERLSSERPNEPVLQDSRSQGIQRRGRGGGALIAENKEKSQEGGRSKEGKLLRRGHPTTFRMENDERRQAAGRIAPPAKKSRKVRRRKKRPKEAREITSHEGLATKCSKV